jgi:hypothetical protein
MALRNLRAVRNNLHFFNCAVQQVAQLVGSEQRAARRSEDVKFLTEFLKFGLETPNELSVRDLRLKGRS